MKTNIKELKPGVFGKFVDIAMYAIGGNSFEGWETEIADIYQLIDGSYVAYDCGIVFPVEDTDWKPSRKMKNIYPKRGHKSMSNNKKRIRDIEFERHFESLDDLPF